MNGDGGWIKIHRSIWDNPWMYRPNVFIVWTYILCHVEFQPKDVVFEGKRVTLQPGQGLFRFTEVAELLGIPTPTLYRIVDLLKNEKQIEKQSSPRNTVITVVNWLKYQVDDKQNEKQVRNKRETNEKQMRNLPYSNKNLRSKEVKNIYGEYQNVKLTDEELAKLKAEFPDWKERIERLSEYIDSRGDKYKNHLSTIRSWARRDREQQPQSKPQEESIEDMVRRKNEELARRKAEGKVRPFSEIMKERRQNATSNPT